MERRTLLKILAAASLSVPSLAQRALAAPPKDMKGIMDMQKNWRALLADGTNVPAVTEALKLSKDEWRKRLEPQAYSVLREEGTERPGTSPLNDEKRPGVFVCAGCGL